MNELAFSTFVEQSWLSPVLKEGEASSPELVFCLTTESDGWESFTEKEKTGVMSSDRRGDSLILSHITSSKVYKASMLLFFWVIPLGDCYAAFQPSVVQSDRQIRWFECFPLTSCRRLQKGFISLVSRVMWLCCLCNCQQRYDCEEEGFKTFVYSLGAPLKPPCGWCHRGSHNHRNHICVHTNKMIKRSQISLDYFDCHWKQRWFGA